MRSTIQMLAALLPLSLISQVCEANAVYTEPTAVPTLNEFGLIGLIILICIAAGLVLRRHAK